MSNMSSSSHRSTLWHESVDDDYGYEDDNQNGGNMAMMMMMMMMMIPSSVHARHVEYASSFWAWVLGMACPTWGNWRACRLCPITSSGAPHP